ncbi:unnamed protein product [Urochloa humidicola]
MQTGVEAAGQGRRRRHRARGRRSAGDGGGLAPSGQQGGDGGEVEEDPFPPSLSSEDTLEAPAVRPRRVLDRSASISQKEDVLGRRGLVITVLNGSHEGIEGSIKSLVAGRFGIDVDVLTLFRSGPASFILLLADDESTTRVYNGGQPIIDESLRLHVMRWRRLIGSSVSSLPTAVDIELRGIPAHAWDLATSEQLLNEFCWIGGIHPANDERRDVFRVAAWCSTPERIPTEMDLDIIEPQLLEDGSVPAKRLFSYPITISVAPFVQPSMAGDPSLPPPVGDGRGRRRRRRRRTAPVESPAMAAAGGTGSTSNVRRGPVHARLGPRPVDVGHVSAVRCSPSRRMLDASSPVPRIDPPASPRILNKLEALQINEPACSNDSVGVAACECIQAAGAANCSPEELVQDIELAAPVDILLGPTHEPGGPCLDVGPLGASTSPIGPAVWEPSPSPQPTSSLRLVNVPELECFREAGVSPPIGLAGAATDATAADGTAARDAPAALPCAPEEDPTTPQAAAVAASPPSLRVYSRQRRKVNNPAPSLADGSGQGPEMSSPILKMNKACRPVDSLLPLPVIQKRRRKVPPPGSLPRRSRRVAGAAPCSPRLVTTEAQRRVMRQLGFSEREVITPEAQDRYCKLYKTLDSDSNLAALAAIFGWTVGDGEQARAVDILTVL